LLLPPVFVFGAGVVKNEDLHFAGPPPCGINLPAQFPGQGNDVVAVNGDTSGEHGANIGQWDSRQSNSAQWDSGTVDSRTVDSIQ